MLKRYKFNGKKEFSVANLPTNAKSDNVNKEETLQKTAANQLEIQKLQDKLYAEQKEGLIILFQARDAAGKDATIKHVLSGINPQGIDVHSFKQPTHEELAHDFLWRFNSAIPVRGKIAIYNRSYYEDVLVVKVHELYKNYNMPERTLKDDIIENRYEQIRNYEEYLYQNGYRIIKIFLNVSAKTQKQRFLERIDQPEKNWKFSDADLAERALWPEYTDAYEQAINNTATKHNPWYVFPADQKWYTQYLVSEAILHVMRKMDPQYPSMSLDKRAKLADYKQALLEEGPVDSNIKASKLEKEAAKNAAVEAEVDRKILKEDEKEVEQTKKDLKAAKKEEASVKKNDESPTSVQNQVKPTKADSDTSKKADKNNKKDVKKNRKKVMLRVKKNK